MGISTYCQSDYSTMNWRTSYQNVQVAILGYMKLKQNRGAMVGWLTAICFANSVIDGPYMLCRENKCEQFIKLIMNV